MLTFRKLDISAKTLSLPQRGDESNSCDKNKNKTERIADR